MLATIEKTTPITAWLFQPVIFVFVVPFSISTVADTQAISYTLQWQDEDYEQHMLVESTFDDSSLYRLQASDSFILKSAPVTPPSDELTHFRQFIQFNIFNSTLDSLQHDDSHGQTILNQPATGSLYQIAYGIKNNRLLSGMNISIENVGEAYSLDKNSLWSLGLYAGGRVGWTGLDADSPLWVLSLVGEYDYADIFDAIDNYKQSNLIYEGKWYITPGVQWDTDSFSLTAGIQLPISPEENNTNSPYNNPEYRLRADFKHRF